MNATHEQPVGYVDPGTSSARDAAAHVARVMGGTIRHPCRCHRCGATGDAESEFTSPYSGLCAACDPNSIDNLRRDPAPSPDVTPVQYEVVNGPERRPGLPPRPLNAHDLELVARHGWHVVSVFWKDGEMVRALITRGGRT
jgi:hypothetical protein